MRTSHCWKLVLLVMMTMVTASSFAQGYPSRPIRIVTADPGGSTNLISRIIAQGISPGLGQQVVIDNRPSALTGDTVAKSAPDGYTLLLNANSIWISTLFQKMPYDPIKDLAPVTMAGTAPNILVVHPSLPVRSVRDLIALAKAHPGELNYGSAGTGGTPHLCAELFKSLAGVNMVRVAYRGDGAAVTALISGEVQVLFASAGAATPLLKSGKLRALAVTSAKPSTLLPNLSTVDAGGVAGYRSASLYGIFAVAGTPSSMIIRLNQEIVRFLQTPVARDALLNIGVESIGTTPEELGAAVKADLDTWAKVIKDAGIRTE